MTCPSSCVDPDCTLPTYAAHLRDVQISPAAMPSRNWVTRTPGQPDEPISATRERQSRFDREGDAYRQLKTAGVDDVTLAEAPTMLKELGG